MTVLLDSSVVIALLREEHLHHNDVEAWYAANGDSIATCPITQGALIRHTMQREESMADALGALGSLTRARRHQFWPDEVSYVDVRTRGVLGHRQVTDAYLAELARRQRGRVATLDRGFAALHKDVAELVPTS